MAQTNGYGLVSDVAVAGQEYDIGGGYVEARPAAEEIEPGLGLKYSDGKAEVVDDAGDSFMGIALFTHALTQREDRSVQYGELTTGSAYREGDAVNVLRKGRAHVEVTADVEAEEDAYVDPSNGKFTNESTDTVSTGGKFRTDADSGELAVVEISLP